MSPPSRLRIDPSTQLPSINSLGELDLFLRGSVADEECRRVSDGMSDLAMRIEAIVATLRLSQEREDVAPLLVDLLTVLRDHRQMVVELTVAWRGLYEYAGYLQALNNFRVLLGQWLLDGGARSKAMLLTAQDFELVAWRTMGEGMLLIDVYEQWLANERRGTPARAGQLERATQWWQRLRR